MRRNSFSQETFLAQPWSEKEGFGTPEILCSFYYVDTAELVIFTREDHLSLGKKKNKQKMYR